MAMYCLLAHSSENAGVSSNREESSCLKIEQIKVHQASLRRLKICCCKKSLYFRSYVLIGSLTLMELEMAQLALLRKKDSAVYSQEE